MKKTLVTSIVGTFLFIGQSAFALEWLNCSNAKGTLSRTEQEVWGANPVTWRYKGNEVPSPIEIFDEASKVVLMERQVGQVIDSTYAVTVTVRRRDEMPLEIIEGDIEIPSVTEW